MARRKRNGLKIKKPGIMDILQLPLMFTKAINEEYRIYDRATRGRILKRHSILHLLIARFRPGRIIFIGELTDVCVGVVLGTYSSDGVGVVNWIYVLPEHRRNNIARDLLKRLEEEFIEMNCHKLIVTTEVAQKFYSKIGYKQEAILKYHWWEKDFYLFSKILK